MHCLRWWLPIFLLPLPAASPFMMILFVVTYTLRTKPCAYCSVIIVGLLCSTCAFYSLSDVSTSSPSSSSDAGSSRSLVGGDGIGYSSAGAGSSLPLSANTKVEQYSGGGMAKRLRFMHHGKVKGSSAAYLSATTPTVTAVVQHREAGVVVPEVDEQIQQQQQHQQTRSAEHPKQTNSWSSCWIDLSAIGAAWSTEEQQNRQQQPSDGPTSLVTTSISDNYDTDISGLGWWSAPTRRKRPTALHRRAVAATAAKRVKTAAGGGDTAAAAAKAKANAAVDQLKQAATLALRSSPASTISTASTWGTLLRAWYDDTLRNGLLIGTSEQTGFRIKWIVD